MQFEIVDRSGERLTERDAEQCRQVACRAGLHIIDKVDRLTSWTLVVADGAREISIRTALQALATRFPGIRVSVMA